MSIKSKVLAAAATLTMVGGLGTAGALSASAATPSCGSSCIDIFSYEFGHHSSPNFVMDVKQGTTRAGTPIILYRSANNDAAEDFTVSFQGTTADFFAAGLVSAAVDLHYGAGAVGFPNDPAFEIEYAPYGVDSGLCVGVFSTAVQGSKVSLEPCGVTSKTVWVADTGDSVTVAHGYVPLVNGSDTNFSHPFVLSYPSNGYPTDKPRPQLTTTNLTGFSGSFLVPELGTVDDNQLWGADFGVLR